MHFNLKIDLAICCSKKRNDILTRDSEGEYKREGERDKPKGGNIPIGLILLGMSVLDGVLKLLTG